MSDFFSMGGYGLYIWPCYVLSAVILGRLGWTYARQVKRLRREVAEMSRPSLDTSS